MSTITDTYVVNLALGHLGDHRISNFNQNDPSAASARDHWEFARSRSAWVVLVEVRYAMITEMTQRQIHYVRVGDR